MDNRTNTFAGWVLAGCAAALGLSIVSGMVLHSSEPEKMGYPVKAEEPAGGAAAKEVPLPTLLAQADPAKGEQVFKKCQACHTVNQGGPNNIGPNLYGTLGEPIAKGKNGFAFSDALKSVGGTWDFEKMNAWLTSPRKFASGTKMTFAGISDPQERADVLVYLNQQGSNLPLPAAPKAEPAAAAKDIKDAETGKPTAGIANNATPNTAAPDIDPQAAVQAEKKGAKPK